MAIRATVVTLEPDDAPTLLASGRNAGQVRIEPELDSEIFVGGRADGDDITYPVRGPATANNPDPDPFKIDLADSDELWATGSGTVHVLQTGV